MGKWNHGSIGACSGVDGPSALQHHAYQSTVADGHPELSIEVPNRLRGSAEQKPTEQGAAEMGLSGGWKAPMGIMVMGASGLWRELLFASMAHRQGETLRKLNLVDGHSRYFC